MTMFAVVGSDRVDAGKTSFAVGLITVTDAIGFKPRAGNNYWFHHDDVVRAVDDGRMYGKDARLLVEASQNDLAPEDINPIHRLWRPRVEGGVGLLGKPDQEFVVDRVGEEYIVNATATVPELVQDSLPLDDATTVSTLEEFNSIMEERHIPELDTLHDTIQETETVVVESYGDIARPIRGLKPSVVAVVQPGRVRMYDGSRYSQACSLIGDRFTSGQLETRVDDVLDLIEPVSEVRLPALVDAVRHDPQLIAQAYGDAYDELVAYVADSTPHVG